MIGRHVRDCRITRLKRFARAHEKAADGARLPLGSERASVRFATPSSRTNVAWSRPDCPRCRHPCCVCGDRVGRGTAVLPGDADCFEAVVCRSIRRSVVSFRLIALYEEENELHRRDLLVLGGTAIPWPLAARGQQKAMPMIGRLDTTSPAQAAPFLAAFNQGLHDAWRPILWAATST